jgi:hypothetical protein
MTILSSGNIGINTSAPNEKLETVGVSRITKTTSPSVYLNIGMENNTAEYDARGSIDQVWKTQALERMRLTLGGNLGVGTVSPDSMLTVNEGARFLRGVRMSGLPSAPGTRALRIDANGTLSVADTTTGGGIGGSGTINRLAKFTASGTIGNSSIADSSSSVAMTISSFANVGIGTATPSSRLEVSGNATIKTNFASLNLDNTTSTTPVWMKINNGGGNYLMGVANNSGTTIMSSTTSPYAFVINAQSSRDVVIGTNDLERMRVDSTGKVGIGTTTIDSMLTVAQGAYFQRGVRMSGLPTAVGTKALRIDANGTLSVADTTTGGGGGISGSGTTNYIPKFTSSTAVGNSRFFDNGTITFLGNGDVNAAPSTAILSGTGGSGTNIAGAEFRIRGGAGTGTGVGGPITFYTSAAGTTGSTVNAATERMRLSAGNLLINQTASLTGVTNSVELTGAGNTDGTQQAIYSVFANHGTFAANTGYFVFNKSRGTTAGSVTAVASGDRLGMIRWNGADGTAQIRAAEIYSEVDGTPGTNDMPGRIVFATTLDGASSPTERMRITSGGSIGIATTTIGSTLQVNGNAAIGYSASTAAPTNGLAVAGQSTFADNISITRNQNAATRLIINNSNNNALAYSEIIINTTTTAALGKFSPSTTAVKIISGSDYYLYNEAGGDIAILNNFATGNIKFAAGGSSTAHMTITSGGSIGIATTTIGSRLQVNGGAAIGYSASTAAPTNGLIVAGNAYFGGQIASLTDVMQLKGSGNVLIAMQSTVNTQFSGMNLYNEAGTLAASFALGNSNTGSFSNHFFLGPRTASGNLLFVTGASGTTRMTMTTNGELQFTPAANTSVLSTTGAYSLTGSNAQSLIDLAGTWNTTGNPTAIKLNITNTASGTGADLMELQVGGVNQFIVGKSGSGYFKDMLTVEPQTANTSAIKTDGYSLTGSNAQSLLAMTGTWNTTGNPTAIKLDITNTASGSSSYLMDLLVGGTTQFRVAKDGAIRTTAPTGGTADNWKFGTKVASSVVFDDNDYLEVEVGGTLYRVALVNLAEPEPEAIPASTPEDRRINLPAKTSSQRIQELENEIQELKQMIKFLMPTSKNKK